MCGPRARTNFPFNPNNNNNNVSPSSSSKLLSPTLTAKLHRCYVASLQITRPSSSFPDHHSTPNSHIPFHPPNSTTNNDHDHSMLSSHKRGLQLQHNDNDPNWTNTVKKKVKVENDIDAHHHHHQFIKPLEEDHIEQMIQELLYYGSVELSSVMD